MQMSLKPSIIQDKHYNFSYMLVKSFSSSFVDLAEDVNFQCKFLVKFGMCLQMIVCSLTDQAMLYISRLTYSVEFINLSALNEKHKL